MARTFLLMEEVGPVVLGDRYAALSGAQAWAAFLFASYIAGHRVIRVKLKWRSAAY